MALISRKYLRNKHDSFWNFAQEVQIGHRIIRAWRNKQACGFILHFAVNGEDKETLVSIGAFYGCVFGKDGTYKKFDVDSFPSICTEEGLYRLVNWMSVERLI